MFQQLARNLLAAFIANRMGITIGYALKAHVPDEPGDYWLRLAETVERDIKEEFERKFSPARKGSVQ